MGIQIGDRLGDYEVIGVLGRGGMGKVFRVRSVLTEREEAMKIVLPDLDENPGLADRFLREIKVHASLQHPNIATLHTALRIGERLVMILELVEGVSLEEKLREGPVELSAAVSYMTQVLAALAFAHERGVIHRDIKPANILIAAGGVAKLTDFGIARSAAGTRLTGAGLAVGTLAYMSPEQIRSDEIDGRSDLYSLGLTFYETITGRRAIDAGTEHALMNAQLAVMPPDPALLNPAIPRPIADAILRAVSKERERRFATAGEFAAALHGVAPERRTVTMNAPPAPAPELADLEARLSRAVGPIAHRLVADAARRYKSISEIRQALAAQIAAPKDREAFLKTDPAVPALPASATTAAPIAFDRATLDRLAHALAPYLGPIANMLVNRAVRTARSVEDLQNALASEIASADDRRRFLAAVRSPF
jgi:serine/threonine protein kinase